MPVFIKGEFGVVYRAHLTGWQDRMTAKLVAVKTLKSKEQFYEFAPTDSICVSDTFSEKAIGDLIKESEKIIKFKHLHVLSLIGVCVDSETPYIVMPYMANGSLLVYLKKHRPNLTIAQEAGEEMVTCTITAQTHLARS